MPSQFKRKTKKIKELNSHLKNLEKEIRKLKSIKVKVELILYKNNRKNKIVRRIN